MAYDWLYRSPPPRFIEGLNKYAAEDGTLYPGITKLLEFDAYEGAVPRLVAIDRTTRDHGLTKLATPFDPELLKTVDSIPGDSSRILVLGTAMGAMEK